MSLLDALLLDAQRINLWIAVRFDGNKGSGTQSDPYNSLLFDDIMDDLPASPPVRVNLGPGEFTTQGYADGVSGGWQPKPGMKIVGSGIDVSVLKLVGAQDPGSGTRHYWAIGHLLGGGGSLMSHCEVSDLTIDCNLGNQSGTQFACGAVRLMGHHTKVYRVKAIHWGTKASGPACRVISMITGDPSWTSEQIVDTGMQDCIAIDPDANTAGPVAVLHVGGKAPPGADQEGVGLRGYIRNCYVDCGALANPLSPEVRALSMEGCGLGVVEGNEVHRVRIGGPYMESVSARQLIVRDNTYRNVRRGPHLNLGQKSGDPIAVNDLTFVGSSAPYQVTANIDDDHHLNVGDRVELDLTPASLSGVVEVTEIVSATSFKYVWPGASGTLTSGTMEKVFGVGQVEIEGNTIQLATGADGELGIGLDDDGLAGQEPDHVFGDVTIRDNKISYEDGLLEESYDGTAIEVNGVRNLNVQDNVVEVAPGDPILDRRSGSAAYFNNKTPAGELIRGYRPPRKRCRSARAGCPRTASIRPRTRSRPRSGSWKSDWRN